MGSAARTVERMVEQDLRGRGIVDEAVLGAMRAVPRAFFVPEACRGEAYADRALPTADGQTISQPYIVARMTELLAARPGDRVLEVGTGSGYQAAVLAHVGARVISIESRPALAASARMRLAELGLGRCVEIVIGDGTLGHEPGAPYDRAVVTAAAPHLPAALRGQLADGGRCVLPIGDRELQYLTIYERCGAQWHSRRDIACRFVPLVGADGWT